MGMPGFGAGRRSRAALVNTAIAIPAFVKRLFPDDTGAKHVRPPRLGAAAAAADGKPSMGVGALWDDRWRRRNGGVSDDDRDYQRSCVAAHEGCTTGIQISRPFSSL